MRELWISNINSADAKELANEWDSYLSRVGCEIYISAVRHRMIIEWYTTTQDTLISILSFVDDIFDDTVDLRKLNMALKNLEDNQAVSIDFNSGDIEIKVL